jgi:hypothetical protein
MIFGLTADAVIRLKELFELKDPSVGKMFRLATTDAGEDLLLDSPHVGDLVFPVDEQIAILMDPGLARGNSGKALSFDRRRKRFYIVAESHPHENMHWATAEEPLTAEACERQSLE